MKSAGGQLSFIILLYERQVPMRLFVLTDPSRHQTRSRVKTSARILRNSQHGLGQRTRVGEQSALLHSGNEIGVAVNCAQNARHTEMQRLERRPRDAFG